MTEAEFNCQRCGWCCREVNINIAYSDILRWAKEKRFDILNQISYIDNPDPKKKGFFITETVLAPKRPCPFLETASDGLSACGIYDTRPRACKEFPSAHATHEKREILCPARGNVELLPAELFELKRAQSLDYRLAEDRKEQLLDILTKVRTIGTLLAEIKAFGDDPQEDLWVNGEGGERVGWTEVGDSPYLDAQDQPANYIWTTTKKSQHGDFTFSDSAIGVGTINSVTLYVYGQQVGSLEPYIFLWDGVDWTDSELPDLAGAWGWQSVAVTAILDTWAKIDGAKMYIAQQNTANRVDIDAAYLLIDYSLTSASATDATTLADTITATRVSGSTTRNIDETDAATLADTVTLKKAQTLTLALTDNFDLADTFDTLKLSAKSEALTDNTTLADTITYKRYGTRYLALTDNFDLADSSVVRNQTNRLALTDNFDLADSLVTTKAQILSQSLTDNFDLADSSVVRNQTNRLALTDNFDLADTISTTVPVGATRNIALTDNMALGDSTIRRKLYYSSTIVLADSNTVFPYNVARDQQSIPYILIQDDTVLRVYRGNKRIPTSWSTATVGDGNVLNEDHGSAYMMIAVYQNQEYIFVARRNDAGNLVFDKSTIAAFSFPGGSTETIAASGLSQFGFGMDYDPIAERIVIANAAYGGNTRIGGFYHSTDAGDNWTDGGAIWDQSPAGDSVRALGVAFDGEHFHFIGGISGVDGAPYAKRWNPTDGLQHFAAGWVASIDTDSGLQIVGADYFRETCIHGKATENIIAFGHGGNGNDESYIVYSINGGESYTVMAGMGDQNVAGYPSFAIRTIAAEVDDLDTFGMDFATGTNYLDKNKYDYSGVAEDGWTRLYNSADPNDIIQDIAGSLLEEIGWVDIAYRWYDADATEYLVIFLNYAEGDLGRELQDDLDLADSITVQAVSGAAVRNIAVTDNFNLTDTLATKRYGTRYLNIADNLDLADTLATKRDAVRYLTLTDNLDLSDTLIRKRYGTRYLNIADSVTLADTFNTRYAHRLLLTDALTLADTVTLKKAQTLTLALTDNFDLTDTITTYELGVIYLNIADSFTLADTITPTVVSGAKSIALTEALTLADTVTLKKAQILTLALTDNFDLADTITTYELGVIYLNIADSFTLADTFNTRYAHRLLLTDALTLTDTVTTLRKATHTLALTDYLTLADTFASKRLGTRILSITDYLTLADTFASSQIGAASLNITDAFTLADTAASLRKGTRYLSITDVFTLADTIEAKKAQILTLALTDNFDLTDTITTYELGVTYLSITDSFTLADTFNTLYAHRLLLTDAVTLADTISPVELGVLSLALTDHFTLADTFNTRYAHRLLLTDAVTLADTIEAKKAQILTQALTDNFALADTIFPVELGVLSLALTDHFELADSLDTLYGHRLLLTDSLTLADAYDALRKGVRTQALTDSLTLADTLDTLYGHRLLLTDSLTLADTISVTSKALYKSITVTDAFTLADSLSTLRSGTRFLSITDYLTLADTLSATGAISTTRLILLTEALSFYDLAQYTLDIDESALRALVLSLLTPVSTIGQHEETLL